MTRVHLSVLQTNVSALLQQRNHHVHVPALHCNVQSGVAKVVHSIDVIIAGLGQEAHLEREVEFLDETQRARARAASAGAARTELACPSAAATCKWLEAEPYWK